MRNWVYYMQEGLKSMWKSKEVPDYRKKEMDKMQKELMECGCLPDCGCK